MAISWVGINNLKGLEQFETSCFRLNRFSDACWLIMMELSSQIGWKGPEPLGFKGFQGYYVDMKADTLTFMKGDEEIGRVEMNASGNVDIRGDLFLGMDDKSVATKMASLVVSEENVKLAMEFCAFGRFRVTGFVDGVQPYFVSRPNVPGYDDSLKEYCIDNFGREPVLLSESDYRSTLEKLNYGGLSVPGAELVGVTRRGESPGFVQLDFDGESMCSLMDMFDLISRSDHYRPFVQHCKDLEGLCSELSHRLVRHCGLADEKDASGLYHFENAFYTMMDGGSETLHVVSYGGEQTYIDVVPSHYREPGRAFKVREGHDGEIRFMSYDDLRSHLERCILSRENIASARKDFVRGGFPLKDFGQMVSKKGESVGLKLK